MWSTNYFLQSEPDDVKQNKISNFEVKPLFLNKLMDELGYSEHGFISTM